MHPPSNQQRKSSLTFLSSWWNSKRKSSSTSGIDVAVPNSCSYILPNEQVNPQHYNLKATLFARTGRSWFRSESLSPPANRIKAFLRQWWGGGAKYADADDVTRHVGLNRRRSVRQTDNFRPWSAHDGGRRRPGLGISPSVLIRGKGPIRRKGDTHSGSSAYRASLDAWSYVKAAT